jgi:hypothetical protein
MSTPLRIRLVVDPARARVWHRRLAETLAKRGHRVFVAIERRVPGVPLAVFLLMTLERLVYGAKGETAATPWKPEATREKEAFPPDVILDMTGAGHVRESRTLRPVFAASLLEEAAISALLSGRIPEVGILDSASPSQPRLFRAAVERPRVIIKALDNLGARLVTIFASAVEDIAHGRSLSGRPAPALDLRAQTRVNLIAAATARARLALTSLSSKPPHWFVGWRRAVDDRVAKTLSAPASGWQKLADDGARFYADPFLVHREGRTWLFLEEFQYAIGKALISVVEFGPEGPIGTPRPVLESPSHLSYPFLFEQAGEIFMVPEMSAARRVELLRATRFPDSWETAGVLIDGKTIADATIVAHDNKLWLFAVASEPDESSWDALHIWHAQSLTGEWRAHAGNPVLIDAASARPAGSFFRRGSELWRPAQDCTAGYGSGLALARVTQLDERGFAQEIRTVLRPGPAWPGIGLHTLNWAAGFEVVDGAGDRQVDLPRRS